MANRRTPRTRRVIFQPHTYKGLQRGMNMVIGAVRPTLGPLPRHVAIHQVATNRMPELASKGGIIARRIIQLADRDADMGAMLVRHMLWELHERYGDGVATAAVIFEAVYNQGVTYIASGGNAMRLRHYLEQGARVMLDELDRQSMPIEGKDSLARIATSVCGDAPLGAMLGEIFDIIGEFGQLEIRPLRSRELRREYVDGMVWDAKPFSREMVGNTPRARATLENPAILISDLEFEDAGQLVPLLELVKREAMPSLLILANKVAAPALALLMANLQAGALSVVAVRTPGSKPSDEITQMEDLAILTGGRPFLRATHDTLNSVRLADLGRARRAWAESERFGVVGGAGSPRVLRQHIRDLRGRFQTTHDPEVRTAIQQRIGKFMGGAATLRVGGATQVEIDTRKELAERTAGSVRAAIRGGVLPGGGVALLACRPALKQSQAASQSPDERAALRTLVAAVEAPFRNILRNSGYDDSEAMAGLRVAGPGYGFDVISGQIVDVVEAGILDVTEVHRAAVHTAIMTAALALTVDVLIHHKDPEEVLDGT